MNRKYLLLCGVLASLVYVAAVILGGLLRPGYSHTHDAISELLTAGAPNIALLNPLFTVYDLLLAGFGIGLVLTVNASPEPLGKRSGMVGGYALIIAGIIGVLMNLFFPQDPGGPPVTSVGTIHVALAGVLSLGTMVAMLSTGLWLRHLPALHGYWIFTLVCLAIVFVSGGLGAAAIASGSPYLGLVERVTIGTFLVWVLVIALKLFLATPAASTSSTRPDVRAA